MSMRGPKVKFDKETIISKSRDYVDENGIHKISIRNLANYIGCSTQPIVRIYKNSEKLLQDLYCSIDEYYEEFTDQIIKQTETPFLGMGMGYINFAKEHPNLFYVLFMNTYYKKESLLSFFQNEESDKVIMEMSLQIGLSKESCRFILRDIWLLTHGIATMIYTKQVDYHDDEVKEILFQGFYGIIAILKSKEKDHA